MWLCVCVHLDAAGLVNSSYNQIIASPPQLTTPQDEQEALAALKGHPAGASDGFSDKMLVIFLWGE